MVKFMYQGTKLLYRLERQSPRAHRLRRVNHYTRPGQVICCNPQVVVPYIIKRKEGTMYQGTKNSFALPVELTCKLMAAHMGIEPMT